MDEPILFPITSSKDVWKFTGDYIISDGEKVILAHHETDDYEEEWTMIDKEYVAATPSV